MRFSKEGTKYVQLVALDGRHLRFLWADSGIVGESGNCYQFFSKIRKAVGVVGGHGIIDFSADPQTIELPVSADDSDQKLNANIKCSGLKVREKVEVTI